MENKVLYRYEITNVGEGYYDNELRCAEFPVISETERSYLIDLRGSWKFNGKYVTTKRVMKGTSKRGFAHETKRKALNNFIRRTGIRMGFLFADLKICTEMHERAKNELALMVPEKKTLIHRD